MTDEEKIRKAFAEKDWHEIKAGDSWQIFKIMSEFVEGFVAPDLVLLPEKISSDLFEAKTSIFS